MVLIARAFPGANQGGGQRTETKACPITLRAEMAAAQAQPSSRTGVARDNSHAGAFNQFAERTNTMGGRRRLSLLAGSVLFQPDASWTAEHQVTAREEKRGCRAEVGARSVIVVGDLPEFGPHFHVWYWYTLVKQLDRGRQPLYLWARDNGAVG
ncbi:hypothetical protein HBI56_041820 [Parastagonospora nodorum]|nr:hypothetical protein HBH52_042430 [Parastagonospora nodorum]KAH4005136.1 hypothetical protein HBI10_045120 [Parastagonospora nodorum]KAH4031085.1 hypothetical protein HBI13_028570 [Parastagonospora nodorum]KAH4040181.1 hypothetical protein HBI09_024750 [Parastagonospora nodorum]KAH4071500.1 hypothetical protein HBH50_081480 [Parastagonospora nodorum]